MCVRVDFLNSDFEKLLTKFFNYQQESIDDTPDLIGDEEVTDYEATVENLDKTLKDEKIRTKVILIQKIKNFNEIFSTNLDPSLPSPLQM